MTAGPHTVIYDIENAPLLAYSWGPMYDTSLLDIVEETYLLSFAQKVHGSTKQPTFHRKAEEKGDDFELTKKLWQMFDDADVLIAHNGDAFDQKKARTRFLFYGLPDPSPFIEIDTLKLLRQKFKLTSNKLNEACKFLGIGAKTPNQGMHTWYGCMENDPASWRVMKKYNIQDVVITEKLYDRISPYVKTKLNMQAWSGLFSCTTCGSKNLESRGYQSRGGTERSHRNWRCLEDTCGAWSYELLSNVGRMRKT